MAKQCVELSCSRIREVESEHDPKFCSGSCSLFPFRLTTNSRIYCYKRGRLLSGEELLSLHLEGNRTRLELELELIEMN